MKYLILLTGLFLIGCATSYQRESFSGGYSDMKVGPDMYQVNFSGNGYTSSKTTSLYLLRRCAEIAREQGYQYFAFIEKGAENSTYQVNQPTTTTIQPRYGGGYQATSYNNSYTVSKPSNNGVIKLFKEGTQPPSAYGANDILSNFEKN